MTLSLSNPVVCFKALSNHDAYLGNLLLYYLNKSNHNTCVHIFVIVKQVMVLIYQFKKSVRLKLILNTIQKGYFISLAVCRTRLCSPVTCTCISLSFNHYVFVY